MSLKELSIFTSIFCIVQVFVTKLPLESVMLNCAFCVPIDKYSVISKEFSPATAVFVATILPPTFQVAVPSVIGSSEESVPENSYLIITLSLTVATIGEVVIYLILSVLLVLLPPLPPTIVNCFLAAFTSLSFPSFSISYKTYLYLLDLCFKYNLTESKFAELIYNLNRYYVKKGQSMNEKVIGI